MDKNEKIIKELDVLCKRLKEITEEIRVRAEQFRFSQQLIKLREKEKIAIKR